MPNSETEPVRVLFVCLGNICRSPMAEAVFCHLVAQAGLADRVTADSAGTGDYHVGEPPHHGTRRILQERGIRYAHAARVVAPDDFECFDYIVAMDRSNLATLRGLAQRAGAEMGLLMDYAREASMREVPDPYYSGRFAEVYDLVTLGCRRLLEHIIAQRGLTPRAPVTP